MRIAWLVAMAAVVVGCGGPNATPVRRTITGTFDLVTMSGVIIPGGAPDGGIGCAGSGGYSDVQEGMGITVKDESGKILATGTLGKGALGPGFSETNPICRFLFTITNVPDTATFYSVEAGRRGATTYSHEDMVANNWTVALQISD